MREITIQELDELTGEFQISATAYGHEIKAVSKGEK